MEHLTLGLIGQMIIGLAIWVVFALLFLVPETKAQSRAWLREVRDRYIVVNRYQDDYVDDEEAEISTRTGTRTDGSYQYAPDTTAVNPDTENVVVPYQIEPSSLIDADSELVTHLASLQYSTGKWRMSANAIHAAVGGSRAEVLDQIRTVRGGEPPAPPKPDPRYPELTAQGRKVSAALKK